MHSAPLIADFPISHVPMQPSTHVTHMPLNGLMLPGVRFLDPVAADLLILVIAMPAPPSSSFVCALRRPSLPRPAPSASLHKKRDDSRFDYIVSVGAQRRAQSAGHDMP